MIFKTDRLHEEQQRRLHDENQREQHHHHSIEEAIAAESTCSSTLCGGSDQSLKNTATSRVLIQSNQSIEELHECNAQKMETEQQIEPSNEIELADSEDDIIMLPQSAYSLFITNKHFTAPHLFASSIRALATTCLLLVMVSVTSDGSPGNPLGVPQGVGLNVQVSQYIAIVIGIIMEEEIPLALDLLRNIPKESFSTHFPNLSFHYFVFTTSMRFVQGYIYLFDLFFVTIQARDVLTVLFNILALQFVEQIDDVAFQLAKISVFGQRLKNATTHDYFRIKIKKKPDGYRPFMRNTFGALYFFNGFVLLAMLAIVTRNQNDGKYHCKSITVTFGDQIWEDAFVKSPNGTFAKEKLIYSYFNGVYVANGTFNRRPRYIEQNKLNGKPFKETTPAEIVYCSDLNAWVFRHEDIRKSHPIELTEPECSWLLRSPETSEYSLVEVPNNDNWSIWVGRISKGTSISILCDECAQESDCNFHGSCVNKECQCRLKDGYFGIHCEHETPCAKLYTHEGDEFDIVRSPLPQLFQTSFLLCYNRPIYVSTNSRTDSSGEYIRAIVYAGQRWFGTRENANLNVYEVYNSEYHAMWGKVFSNKTVYVSDPTDSSTPVGVDIYESIAKYGEYGPLGILNKLTPSDVCPYETCDL